VVEWDPLGIVAHLFKHPPLIEGTRCCGGAIILDRLSVVVDASAPNREASLAVTVEQVDPVAQRRRNLNFRTAGAAVLQRYTLPALGAKLRENCCPFVFIVIGHRHRRVRQRADDRPSDEDDEYYS
jgi:hypothetical protein